MLSLEKPTKTMVFVKSKADGLLSFSAKPQQEQGRRNRKMKQGQGQGQGRQETETHQD
jgi:hypothetical protein